MENCILVKKENNQIYLTYKSLKAEATIGKNGLTNNLVESKYTYGCVGISRENRRE